VIIGGWQKLGYPIIQPFFLGHGLAFGTMAVPAGVVGVLLIITVGANLKMPSQGCCPAGYNPVHDLYLFMGGTKGLQKLLS